LISAGFTDIGYRKWTLFTISNQRQKLRYSSQRYIF